MTALAAAALVILIAQPAYAGERAPTCPATAQGDCQMAVRLSTDELRAPAADDGFLRLLYRDRRDLGDLLRQVGAALPDLCIGDEII
jgi:hypothetical protein